MEKFPNFDITHKSERTQQGNIEAMNRLRGVDSNSTTDGEAPPVVYATPESAIQYYTQNAKGPFLSLYNNTARWLTEYLQLKAMKARYESKLAEKENAEKENAEN